MLLKKCVPLLRGLKEGRAWDDKNACIRLTAKGGVAPVDVGLPVEMGRHPLQEWLASTSLDLDRDDKKLNKRLLFVCGPDALISEAQAWRKGKHSEIKEMRKQPTSANAKRIADWQVHVEEFRFIPWTESPVATSAIRQ